MIDLTKKPVSENDHEPGRAGMITSFLRAIATNQHVLGVATLLILAASAFAMFGISGSAMQTYQLIEAPDEDVEAILAKDNPGKHSATYHGLLAERAAALEITDLFSAQLNVRKALEINPQSPQDWAHLAYLVTVTEDGLTPEAIEAVKTSIALCQYCDVELNKWRLGFILVNWQDMPPELQDAARLEARILKADTDQHDYLRNLIIRARLQGIDLGIETNSLELPDGLYEDE